MENVDKIDADFPYICVKSHEKGVNVIGLTRGEDTRFHHTEKLDEGEVLIVQFTENTSAIKIRGNADIYTAHGVIHSGGKGEE
jgi:transcription attenuation protein (tryptophan RNA-binding attenuator protein)